MSKPKIRVLLIEPLEHPKEYRIEPSRRRIIQNHNYIF